MSVQVTHIVTPTNVKYYDVDSNKTIEDIEKEIYAQVSDSPGPKAVMKGCKTETLNKLWPLKFYSDEFFVEIQNPYIIQIEGIDGEFNVYLNPRNMSEKKVIAALRDVIHDDEQRWILEDFGTSFTLDSQKENKLIYKVADGCAYYDIKASKKQGDTLQVVTKKIFCGRYIRSIQKVLQLVNVSILPQGTDIESWMYKVEINGQRVTDISGTHPNTINTMEIYPDLKKYSVTYEGAVFTGNADDTLIMSVDIKELRRKDTKVRPTSLKFGDICGKEKNVELEFDYDYYDGVADSYQIFIKTLTGTTISAQVHSNMSIKALKYLICDKEGIHPSQQRYVFSGLQLKDNENLGKLGIKDLSTIHLILRLCGGGGGCEFVDISKGLKAKSFSKGGPHWLTCDEGLFIRGSCKNNACAAYNSYVVINKNYEPFDLKYDKYNPKNVCPECGIYVQVKSFGFSYCKYKIEAEFTNGEKKTIIDSVREGYVEPNVKRSDKTAEYTKFTLSAETLYSSDNFENKGTLVEMKCGEKKIDVNIADKTVCPICYDVMNICDKKKMCITNCNHIFCKECLPSWLISSKCNKCPMCRTEIDAIYIK